MLTGLGISAIAISIGYAVMYLVPIVLMILILRELKKMNKKRY